MGLASALMLASGCASFNHSEQAENIPSGYKLVYQQDFESATVADFQMTDSAAWAITEGKTGMGLELKQQSKYTPPVRSPVNIALIKNRTFGDFILEADFIQTGREYGHRDMCIFYGYQGPSKFYYTHIATKADPNAHNIFIVNDKPRTNIATKTTEGANWGLDIWHKVRLVRNSADGTIKVFFDDMTTPIMLANDKTFNAGQIGFGSFDDTGKIDNIRIWAPSAQRN